MNATITEDTMNVAPCVEVSSRIDPPTLTVNENSLKAAQGAKITETISTVDSVDTADVTNNPSPSALGE